MTVEENLRLTDARMEALNAHDLDRFLDFHAESVIINAPGLPEPMKGRAAGRELVRGFLTAFPDLHLRKERSFGQGDWVCVESTFTGTHKGPLQGPGGQMVPATNRSFRIPDCTVFKLEGGKVTEVHGYFDLLGMMAQLGLMS